MARQCKLKPEQSKKGGIELALDKSGACTTKTRGGSKNNPAQPKKPSVNGKYKLSTNQYRVKGSKGVLERPTKRSLRLKAYVIWKLDGMGNVETFDVMGLPEELRWMIWELVVVDPNFFVWPDSLTGREQPDLAMVSRRIRAEVLPIYYSKNVFAVDISPAKTTPMGGRKVTVEPKDTAKLEKWAGVLEEGMWFGSIRNWALTYTPMSTAMPWAVAEEDKSLIVAPSFWNPKDRQWQAKVEVHREACCILAGAAEYDMCKVNKAPMWLRTLVIEATEGAARKNLMTKDLIVGLAKSIKVRAHQLVSERCEDAMKSVEADLMIKNSADVVVVD